MSVSLESELQKLRQENIQLRQRLDQLTHKPEGAVASDAELSQFHPLLKDLPYFLSFLDRNLKILYVNRLLPDVQLVDVLGKSLFDVLPKESHSIVESAYAEALSTKAPVEYIVEQVAGNDEIHQISAALQPILDSQGTIVRWLSISHDVSEAVKNKSYLWQAQQRYRALLDQSAMAVVEWSPDSLDILSWNEGATALFEYSEEESLKMKVTDFCVTEHSAVDRDMALKVLNEKSKSPEARTVVSISKLGQQVHCDWFSLPITSENGDIESIISIGHDVTDRELHRLVLEDARHKSEQLASAKEAFIATVSHELRTPMHGILNAAQMLDGVLAQDLDDYSQAKALNRLVLDSGDALQQLISDVLDISKIEASSFKLEPTGLDLIKLVQSCIDFLKPEADKKRLRLEFKNNISCRLIMADELRLRQILFNLLSNAIKFTSKGKVLVKLEEELINANSRHFIITVKDSGIGIDESHLDAIFDRFAQTDTNKTNLYGGAGLGLAITKRLVDLMDGELQVESTVSSGSTFRFSFCADFAESEAPQKSNKIKRKHFDGMALVVDDNPINVAVCSKQLESLGLSVVSAENGLQALEFLAEDQVDVILMDVQMPVLDGLSAVQQIREQGAWMAEVPIIAMTANQYEQPEAYYEAIGINEKIMKPFSIEDIAALLDVVFKSDLTCSSLSNC